MPVVDAFALPSLLVTALVGIVAYLVRRMVSGFDKLGGKVDTLGERDAKRDVLLAEMSVRLNAVERQADITLRRVDDHSGFLSSHGFRKRGSE